ncbi:hypothetical protein [Streptomyces sp. NPDC054804]
MGTAPAGTARVVVVPVVAMPVMAVPVVDGFGAEGYSYRRARAGKQERVSE